MAGRIAWWLPPGRGWPGGPRPPAQRAQPCQAAAKGRGRWPRAAGHLERRATAQGQDCTARGELPAMTAGPGTIEGGCIVTHRARSSASLCLAAANC